MSMFPAALLRRSWYFGLSEYLGTVRAIRNPSFAATKRSGLGDEYEVQGVRGGGDPIAYMILDGFPI
jgi:hypothetical protein